MTYSLPGVQAVLFDKDGTLIDVDATWGPAMARALSELIPDEGLRTRAAIEIGVEVDTGRLVPDGPVIAESNGQICARLGSILDKDPAAILGPFEAHLSAAARQTVTPIPGVEPVLATLRASGFWIGLATNDGESSAREQLAGLGWLHFFDSVVGYDSGFGEKPEPGMVTASIARAGVTREELVMVGDTDTDLGAAQAAGCRTVLVHAPVRRITPTAHIGTLADLPSLFGL